MFIASLPVLHGSVARFITSVTDVHQSPGSVTDVQRRVQVHHISHRLVANHNGYAKTGNKKNKQKETKLNGNISVFQKLIDCHHVLTSRRPKTSRTGTLGGLPRARRESTKRDLAIFFMLSIVCAFTFVPMC